MAKRITQLDPVVTASDFDLLELVQVSPSPSSKRITVGQLRGAPTIHVKHAGIDVGDFSVLNFEGAEVTIVDNGNGQATITLTPTQLAGGQPVDYDLSIFIGGQPGSGVPAFRHTFTRAITFPGNFLNSDGDATVAASNQAIFPVKKNGVQVGEIRFAASGAVPQFVTTGAAEVSFAAGDVLELTAPSPADGTLANISLTLSGARV